MRSAKVNTGDSGLATQYNNLRSDAYGGSQLLAHQQSSPAMTLYIEPGTCYVGATKVIFAGGNTPSFSAPSANPRIDIVTIDNTGTIAITQGTENVSPVAPAYPNNKLVICEVYNRVSETALYDTDPGGSTGYIYNDVRPFIGGAYIASDNQVDPAAAIQFSKLNAGAINETLIPDADGTRDLGSSGDNWNNVYAKFLRGDGSNLTGINVGNIQLALIACEAINANAAVALGSYQGGPGVQFDNAASGSGSSTAFTVGSNSNRILIAFQNVLNGSATYNGVSMTRVQNLNFGSGVSAFVLVAPATGSHTLTFSGSSDFAIYSYYNAAQTSQPDNSGSGGQNASAPATLNLSITPVADGCLVVACAFSTNNHISSTSNFTNNTQSITNTMRAGDAGVLLLPTASVTMGVTYSSSDNVAGAIISIAPYNPVVYGWVNASSASNNNRLKTFAGIALTTVAQGASLKAAVAGVVSGMSGLVVLNQYYLNDTNGTIGTSPGTNTRKIGISISSTSLLITNIW